MTMRLSFPFLEVKNIMRRVLRLVGNWIRMGAEDRVLLFSWWTALDWVDVKQSNPRCTIALLRTYSSPMCKIMMLCKCFHLFYTNSHELINLRNVLRSVSVNTKYLKYCFIATNILYIYAFIYSYELLNLRNILIAFHFSKHQKAV